MTRNILLFISGLIIFLQSCVKDDPCDKISVKTCSLDTLYELKDTRYFMNISLVDTYCIIRSQNDFENQVITDTIPQIDFITYDLIIGKKFLSSGNSYIEYLLKEDCHNACFLTTVFHQNATCVAPNITWHCLIPKLKNIQKLNVILQLSNN